MPGSDILGELDSTPLPPPGRPPTFRGSVPYEERSKDGVLAAQFIIPATGSRKTKYTQLQQRLGMAVADSEKTDGTEYSTLIKEFLQDHDAPVELWNNPTLHAGKYWVPDDLDWRRLKPGKPSHRPQPCPLINSYKATNTT